MQNVNRKKKVLHFIITDGFSGAESVAAHIIKDLPEDWEGYYVAPEGKGTEIVSNMGVKVITIDTSKPSEVKKLCKKMKPDAVHAHDCRMSMICALAGVSFVSHLHANWDWFKKICPKSILLKFTLRRADSVVCVSNSVLEEFIFSKSIKNKATVLPNTVNKNKITELASFEECEAYDLCFVGRLTEVKAPLDFVRLIFDLHHKFPDIRAVMVGDGELNCEVRGLINELGISRNVDMVGFDENPYKYMKNSKIGVITSVVEGFGLVAVEEMLLGLPVVSTNVGGLKDIVSDSCGLICDSLEGMKEEIEKLLTDKDYYINKSENAMKTAVGYTDREAYISKFTDLYEI